MIREPWFWRSNTLAARAVAAGMAPLAAAYDLAQRTRWRLTRPAPTPIPVICIGNATLGGVGKTPCAIAICELLVAEGVECHFLTRGYGGADAGPLKVDPQIHGPKDVGDEALLLARCAPTWVSRDRRAGAAEAAKAGACAVIMDDGFQNPTIAKTFSILLIDAGAAGDAGRIFPAGPLREPIARAKSRADILIFVGPNREAAERAASEQDSPFAAWLAPVNAPAPQRVVAFSGIGKPGKFFDTLTANRFELARTVAYPDHHRFSEHDLNALRRLSETCKAPLITTEKDYVRLPSGFTDAVMTLPVRMAFNRPSPIVNAMLSAIDLERANG